MKSGPNTIELTLKSGSVYHLTVEPGDAYFGILNALKLLMPRPR